MRDSNFTFPAQNRVCVSITQQMYDRKALDTSANLPLLNSLTHLTYLTSTVPRIRELLTLDGGLERLLEILQLSALPRPPPDPVGDWWGLRGPSTASIFAQTQMASLRHSLSFQCVVNIGVRGSEQIRIRLVQSGTLDVIAQILEVWLEGKGMSIVSGPLGSQAAVDRANALSTSAAAHVRGVVGGAGGLDLHADWRESGDGTMFGNEGEGEGDHDMDRGDGHRHGRGVGSGDKMENIKRWTRDQRARSDVSLASGGEGASSHGLLGSNSVAATPAGSTPALTPASVSETPNIAGPSAGGRERRTHRERTDVQPRLAPSSLSSHGGGGGSVGGQNAEAGPSRFKVSRDGTIKPSQASPEVMAQVREGVLNAETLSHYVIPEDICTDLDVDTDHERHAITVMHALARIAGISKNQLWRYANERSDNAEMVRQYFKRFGLEIRVLTQIHLEAIDRRNERELPRLAIRPPTRSPGDIEFWQVFDPAEYPPVPEAASAARSERTRMRHHSRDMSVDQDNRAIRQPTPVRRPEGNVSAHRRHAGPQMGVTPGGQSRMLMPEIPSRRTMAMDIPTPRAPSAPLPADASTSRQAFHASRPDNTRGSSAAASLPQSGEQSSLERGRDSPAPGSVSSTMSMMSRAEADEVDELRAQLRRTRPISRLNSGIGAGSISQSRLEETAASSSASTPVGTPPAEPSVSRRDRSGTVTNARAHALMATRSGTLRANAELERDRPNSRAGTEDEESTDAEGLPDVMAVEEDINIVRTLDDEPTSTLVTLVGHNITEAQQAQAEVDLAMGAPPGAPGAIQTPRIAEMTPRQAIRQTVLPNTRPGRPGVEGGAPDGPGIVIAAGAPRGFSDLSDLVHVMESVTTAGEITYSDDTILLCLQLLAYLCKHSRVRPAFHHLRQPVHPDLDIPESVVLPERPPLSSTTNLFSLVERFTFRPSPPDPDMQRLPSDIQYWAGVIMRNGYKKVDSCGGIRQCANLSCGRWEKFPREYAKCRRCRRAKYCSKECQSKAWQEGHRFWCYSREPEPGDAAVSGTVIIPSQGRSHRHQRAAEAARQQDPFQGRRWDDGNGQEDDTRMRTATPAEGDRARERIRLHPATVDWAERRAGTPHDWTGTGIGSRESTPAPEDESMQQDASDRDQTPFNEVEAMDVDTNMELSDGHAAVNIPGAPVVSHARPQPAATSSRSRM